MGTTYKVLEKDGLLIELDEGSNRFSLDVTAKDLSIDTGEFEDPHETSVSTRRNLTPEDIVRMGLEMIQVATYWMGDDEFRATLEDKMGSRSSYLASHMRTIGEVATRPDQIPPELMEAIDARMAEPEGTLTGKVPLPVPPGSTHGGQQIPKGGTVMANGLMMVAGQPLSDRAAREAGLPVADMPFAQRMLYDPHGVPLSGAEAYRKGFTTEQNPYTPGEQADHWLKLWYAEEAKAVGAGGMI